MTVISTSAEWKPKNIATYAKESRSNIVDWTLDLLKCKSQNPPGDTRSMAEAVVSILNTFPGVDASVHESAGHIHNVIARLKGRGPGPRLIFNGHMDTFPLSSSGWSVDPRGEVADGRVYGLGVSDMKGGLAASLFAIRALSEFRSAWSGEVVATFAGDEETMGTLGTQYLIENFPEARGDAAIVADVGSPGVLRVGEKGLVWLKLTSSGRSSHAAHVHHGDSAIDKLMEAMGRIGALRGLRAQGQGAIADIVRKASAVSERYSGAGESDVLLDLTVTFGTVSGGRLPNLIADHAEATADIRLPMGISVADILIAVEKSTADIPGMSVEVLKAYEPTWSNPDHALVHALAAAATDVLGTAPVVNMRVGASDARLYRYAGIPTIVCGLTPHNMGAADEFVEAEELMSLGEIFVQAAFSFLNGGASYG